jgi:hypothetical protein
MTQNPTGQEGEMTDREAFRRRSRRGNTTPRMPLCVATRNPGIEMWSHNDPVTLFAALGPSKADLAYTVGCTRFTVAIDDGEPQRRTLRLTHLYRRENGEWKVIQEHSDFQPADHVMPTVPDSVGR